MKKTIIILIVIFTLPIGKGRSGAAQVNVDSLQNIWQSTLAHDTVRLNALSTLISDHYTPKLPDSLFVVAQLQYDFAKKTGHKKWMAEALNNQGLAFYKNRKLKESTNYFSSSLELSKEIGYKKGEANALLNQGLIYMMQGNFDKAKLMINEAMLIFVKIKNKKGQAAVLNSLGALEMFQGQYSKSIANLADAKKIAAEIKDYNRLADILNMLGNLYMRQQDYDQALIYFMESLMYAKKNDDQASIAGAKVNIGAIYYLQGDKEKGYSHYKEGYKAFTEIGNSYGAAGCLVNIGKYYQEKKRYKEALDAYNRSIKLSEETNDYMTISMAKTRIESVYSEQGDSYKAIEIGLAALEAAKASGDISSQSNAAGMLYNSYRKIDDIEKALAMQDMALSLRDSLNSTNNQKALIEQQFKFTYENKVLADSLEQERINFETKLAHKQVVQQKNKQRNVFVSASVLALLLAGGLWNRLLFTRKSKKIIEHERDRSDSLLLNILPEEIAMELKEKGKTDAKDFDLVSILFTDFKDFTKQAAQLSAAELVNEINHCFEAFDGVCEKYKIEKIKTIGDAYMAAGGLPVPTDDSVKNTVLAALEMQESIVRRHQTKVQRGEPAFEMRVGIHTGPVVAGIVGVKKFQYDIWGDTVNTASRMESAGEVGKVNISQETYELLKDDPQFAFESRGKIEAKGKGEMEMYFVTLITS